MASNNNETSDPGAEPFAPVEGSRPSADWLWGWWMPPEAEARAIRRWAGEEGRDADNRVYTLLNNQYNVIYARAQTLMNFAGLVVTVTGFSGRTIAQTSRLAQASLVAGMAFVLAGAAVSILWVMGIRWLSWQMGRAGNAWIETILIERNKKVLGLKTASLLMVVGFLAYGFSIALMLMDPSKVLDIPARP